MKWEGRESASIRNSTGLHINQLKYASFDNFLLAFILCIYFTLTHPDIFFVLNTVAQFMSYPHTALMITAKLILRYVKGTLKIGITLTPRLAYATLYAYQCLLGRPSKHSSFHHWLIFVLISYLGALISNLLYLDQVVNQNTMFLLMLMSKLPGFVLFCTISFGVRLCPSISAWIPT
ncbi:hypothetical protein DVH24_022632 [Malus domestica]|uniref:Uncharacterized protein n=1 Tax=Malus domestica TaxID=3750 RepID=A0A498KL82_MALDO|nr:hypothetical protein DVH24_022632 [Malus domestica]